MGTGKYAKNDNWLSIPYLGKNRLKTIPAVTYTIKVRYARDDCWNDCSALFLCVSYEAVGLRMNNGSIGKT